MELKCEGLDLRIEPQNPPDAEGWMPFQVTVAAPGFSGQFHTEMQPDDLKRFEKGLIHMEAHAGNPCEAVLAGLEPGIHIMLQSDKRGNISGKYQFESQMHEDIPTRLSGGFSLDQTYLKPLIYGLADDLARILDGSNRPEK